MSYLITAEVKQFKEDIISRRGLGTTRTFRFFGTGETTPKEESGGETKEEERSIGKMARN